MPLTRSRRRQNDVMNGKEEIADGSGTSQPQRRKRRGGLNRNKKLPTEAMGISAAKNTLLDDDHINISTPTARVSEPPILYYMTMQENRPEQTEPVNSDLMKMCPEHSSSLKQQLDKAGLPSQLAQCSQCPSTRFLCYNCLYPCPNPGDPGNAVCDNKSCHLVNTLLSCETVTDPNSRVHGCPLFRACPKCHSLIMHVGGCKYVDCKQCNHRFCFICLESPEECVKALRLYSSLTCSKPRASRQRFKT